jgi:putative transposase
MACERQQCAQRESVIQMVKTKRQRQPRIGTRKLHYLLQEPMQQAGIQLGRDRMFDLLRDS